MDMTIVYFAGGLVLLVALTLWGILSRYKKCGSDEVLVVYGKTGGKSSSKCYHGGAAFVWPIIQGYKIMSMKPMQIQCDLKGALSSQKINVDVPTVVTVAISEDPAVMQNAAIRLLGIAENDKEDLIKDVIWGQMRLVVADMTVEQLISDRDNFLGSCKENIDTELRKFGLTLLNINISDIKDSANYIINLGKEAEAKAKYEALTGIELREKEGSIGIATQKKDKDIKLSDIERERQIQVSENEKTREIKTAEIDKERSTVTSLTIKEKEVELRDIEKEKQVQLSEKVKEETVAIRNIEKQKEIEIADLEKQEAVQVSEIEKQKQVDMSVNQSEQAQKVAEQNRLRDAEIARQESERDTEVATHQAKRDAEVAAKQAESKASQESAKFASEASITEAQKKAEARQVSANEMSEAEKERARQEKAAKIALYEAETRKKAAEAEKDATLTENTAGIEVAKSDAQLGKEQAEAERTVGEAKALAAQAIGKADQTKEEEIAKAKAKAEEAKLEAELIIPTKKEAERKKKEAEGYKSKVITEAEADAEAIKIKAEAEAGRIKALKLAEAEGELAMAKVKKESIAAETANIVALKEAGMEDTAIVQWTMKDEYKYIAEADAKKFEHVNTGNVTVVGGPEDAGKFMLGTVEAVQKFSALSGMIPGVSGVLSKISNWDKKQQGELENKKEPKPTKDTDETSVDKEQDGNFPPVE